jgi:hypothetical protein
MSLKAFHLFFIAMSVALAIFMAAWALGQYRAGAQTAYVLVSLASAGTGGALAMYGAKFRRRARQL